MKKIIILIVCLSVFITYSKAQNPKIIWAKSAGGLENEAGYVTSVDQEGNVFVAGTSYSSTFTFSTTVLTNSYTSYPTSYLAKYNTKGELLWVKGGGTGNSYTISTIINDKSGNTFIGGSFASNSLTLGKFTLYNNLPYYNGKLYFAKYSPNGEVLWAQIPETSISCAMYGLGIDDAGFLYTTGHFQDLNMKFGNVKVTNTTTPAQDFFLIKFDSNGNAINGTKLGGKEHDVAKSLRTDKTGNSFITGTFKSTTMILGSEVLENNVNNTKTFDDPTSTTNVFLTKINSDGNVLWARSAGNSGDDISKSVALDQTGNSFICGCFKSSEISFGSFNLKNNNPSNPKSFLTKYDPSGNVLWAISSDQSAGSDEFNSVDTDKEGNVYVCGSFSTLSIKYDTITLNNTNSSGSDIVVLKFSPSGKIIWAKNFGNSNNEAGFSCTVDKDDNVFIAGDFKSGTVSFDDNQVSNNSSGSSDIFLAKIIQMVDTIDTKYCSEDNTLILTAPKGHIFYKWTYNDVIITTSDSILIITNPGEGTIINCAISTVDKQVYNLIPKIVENYQLIADFRFEVINCASKTVQFTDISKSSHYPITYKWTFGDSEISTDKNPTHTFTNSGKHRIILEILNPLSSCADTISKIVQFCSSKDTEWDITLSGQTSFCEGDTVIIKAEGGIRYIWSNGETTDKLYLTEPGVYEVTATNENCCTKTKSIVVTQYKNPLSDFEMSDTKIDMTNNRITFSINPESEVEYSWDLGDGTVKNGSNIEHTYNTTNIITEYIVTLTATKNHGCESVTTKKVQVIPFVPNVFTPNKDGVNELFMAGVDLLIYDRYGKTIYKGSNGWDGTYNGKDMPSDTYFYYLSYSDINKNIQSLKGYITLLR